MVSIRALVLYIDSPGGLVSPSQELYQSVVDLRTEYRKVVVASFGSVAASGGYYAACGADMIVSAPGTLTGSIGVYMKLWQAQDLLDKIGVAAETIRAGDYKEWGGLDRPLTDKERRMLQSVADDTYAQFVEAVHDGRKARFLEILQTDPKRVREAIISENGEIRYPFSEEFIDIIEKYHSAIPAKTERNRQTERAGPTGETRRATRETVTSPTAPLSATPDTVVSATGESVTRPETKKPRPPAAVEERLLKALAYNVADGKVYTGRQALELGLVDKIGTLDDAIEIAARLAGIRGEPHVVETKPLKPSILDLLTKGLAHATGEVHPPLQYRMPY